MVAENTSNTKYNTLNGIRSIINSTNRNKNKLKDKQNNLEAIDIR